MVASESKGIVLFSKNYREKDKLVKIFTETAGKQMFFVRGAHRKNNPLATAILPFTQAVFFGEFRQEGLSYLNGAKDIVHYPRMQQDIFVHAYATYLTTLTDAAIEDRVYDPQLFGFLRQALDLLNQGKMPEVITNIFEVQLLDRFGVRIDWRHCAICRNQKGRFDFSSAYHGVLCEAHWHRDERRYHADPRAIYFIQLFAAITYEQINQISIKPETLQAIRLFLDMFYEEYIGLHLKSKKFIDQMASWEHLLHPPQAEP